MDRYDLAVIGDGPAGCAAALYGVRAGLSTVIIGSGNIGGQVSQTDFVDNYPGITDIAGFELGQRFYNHAVESGAAIQLGTALNILKQIDGSFDVQTDSSTVYAQAVICALGAHPKKAGFIGEESFYGRGVSYCATCDAVFYRNKLVYVVGGGNSAFEEAIFLSRFASKVVMIIRKNRPRASRSIQDKVASISNIEIRPDSVLMGLYGDTLPGKVEIKLMTTGATYCEEHTPGSFGVFVFVGSHPNTALVKELVHLENDGGVVTADDMSTMTPGLYCVGDMRSKYLKQVVTAVADGAVAATAASHYLMG